LEPKPVGADKPKKAQLTMRTRLTGGFFFAPRNHPSAAVATPGLLFELRYNAQRNPAIDPF
jgi:hypothetical protein